MKKKMAQIPSPSPSPTSGFPPMTHNPHGLLMHTDRPKFLQSIICGRGYMNGFYPVSNPYQQYYFDPSDPFRQRSGSLQSMGSTASSHRPERSPSRESTSSHESVMRASPISIPEESPSPSPPSEESESKLLSLLKGSVQSPYSNLFSERKSESSFSSPRYLETQLHTPYIEQNSTSYYQHQKSPITPTSHKSATHSITKKQALFNEATVSSSRHEPYSLSKRQNGYSVGYGSSNNDFPIDLSSKSKRSKVEALAPRRYTMPTETLQASKNLLRARIAARAGGSSRRAEATVVRPPTTPTKTTTQSSHFEFLEPVSPPPRISSFGSLQTNEDATSTHNSILRTILTGTSPTGGGGGGTTPPVFAMPKSSYSSPINGREIMSAPASPVATSFSEPSSPMSLYNFFKRNTETCDQNMVVTIAKKNLLPSNARVTDWVHKSVQFAKNLPEFSSLSDNDQLNLLNNAIARVLLVYMAENDHHFAVTAEAEEANPAKNNTGPEIPTKKSVDCIQLFIKKCQSYNLDATEYDQVKTALIFDTGWLVNNIIIFILLITKIIKPTKVFGHHGLQI